MAYYNRNGKKLDLKIKSLDYLDCGACAEVFRFEDIIFKKYFEDTILDCRINLEIFDILRNINNKHFIQLFEMYSDMSLLELFKHRKGQIPFTIDGYTARYYSGKPVNVLYESTDYLLDNFRGLELLFNIFTENAIIADDISLNNTIVNSNGIIIIDPDMFYMSDEPRCSIAIENKIELLALLRSICISSAVNNFDLQGIKKIKAELSDMEITEDMNVTDEIYKKLKYVKRPIDYFLK